MAHWLTERFAGFLDRPFLASEAGSASYGDLVAAVGFAREHLARARLPAGSIVAVRGDYATATVAWMLALAEAKMIVVPVARVTEDEWQSRVNAAAITHVVTFPDDDGGSLTSLSGAPPPHALVDRLRAAGSAGLILFSSGSSGPPKAMIHDLDALLGGFEDRRARKLVMMVFLLFDHIGGLNTLFGALAGGLFVVAPARRDPETVAALIERYRVNVLPASPTFLNLLLMSGSAERYDLSSLKIITYGTEPMPEALLGRLKAAFPRARLIQTFGTSETGIAQTSSRASDSTFFKIEDPALEWKIVDGELWLRSRTQVLGYLNASMESFLDGGWFNTGDVVEEAGDGFLRILGRGSDLINVGGEKVLPAEVESALLQLPQVADCTVYASPNPITGQSVTADVVPSGTTGASELRKAIRQHCTQMLSRYKMPTKINIVEQLDRSERFKKRRPAAGSSGGPAS
ncbi:MAG: fatty acid--CoA ligase family protein [Opitutales bacterium]